MPFRIVRTDLHHALANGEQTGTGLALHEQDVAVTEGHVLYRILERALKFRQ